MKTAKSSPTGKRASHRRRDLLRRRLRVESLEERRLLAADLLFAGSFEVRE